MSQCPREGEHASTQPQHTLPLPRHRAMSQLLPLPGERMGQGTVPVLDLSILPGGFTPKAFYCVMQRKKISENQPILCYLHCVWLCWGLQSWSQCQPVSLVLCQTVSLVSCQPQRQGWHWAGSAMGLCSASSRTAKPAPCHAPRGDTEMVPKRAQREFLAPPALAHNSFLLHAGRTGSLVSQSHPAGPEWDKPPAHTVPCFFHRFCVSISTELMNNSNMNIIHCIWAGVMSDREEIKSSKRLAGSGPARAGEGWWEGDERLRAHTIPTRASDTQPHFRAA